MRPLVTLLIGASLSASPSLAAPVATDERLQEGAALYAVNCAACHGVGGEGDGPAAQYMQPPPSLVVREFKAGDRPEEVFATVTNGLPGTAMTGFAYLSEEQRWGLVFHVLSLRNGTSMKRGGR